MKFKTIKFATFWVVILGVVALFYVSETYGSGTYRHPRPPLRSAAEFSYLDIKLGKKLFVGTSLAGPAGKSCLSCHGAGKPVPIKRSSLKKKADRLTSLINSCIGNPTRTAGKKLELESPQMIQLGTYLISRYRLPRKAIKYLK